VFRRRLYVRNFTVAEPLARLWIIIRSPKSSAHSPGDKLCGALSPILTTTVPELRKSLQTRVLRSVGSISTVLASLGLRVTMPELAPAAWPPIKPAPNKAIAPRVKSLTGQSSASGVVSTRLMPKAGTNHLRAARQRHDIVNTI
jgi:hypothetical protein